MFQERQGREYHDYNMEMEVKLNIFLDSCNASLELTPLTWHHQTNAEEDEKNHCTCYATARTVEPKGKLNTRSNERVLLRITYLTYVE